MLSPLRVATLLLLTGVLWLLLSVWTNAPAPLTLVVETGHIQMAPAWIRLRVRVEPDPANRALVVAILSDGFETSSLEELDRHSRPTRWIEYKDVPAGEYLAVAEVYRAPLRSWRTAVPVTVIGRE